MSTATAGFSFAATVGDAINFKHINYKKVGHCDLKMNGKPLTTDFDLRLPSESSNYKKKSSIITGANWNKEPGGVFELRGCVTEANSGIVQHAISDSKNSNAEVEFTPDLYKHHKDKDLYFKTLHTDDTALKCSLLSSNEYPSYIDTDPSGEYDQMAIYFFVLYLLASEKAGQQKINIDYDTQIKLSLPFGQNK